MSVVRTYVDAGVLIAAFRGVPEIQARARSLLTAPERLLIALHWKMTDSLASIPVYESIQDALFELLARAPGDAPTLLAHPRPTMECSPTPNLAEQPPRSRRKSAAAVGELSGDPGAPIQCMSPVPGMSGTAP